MIGMGQLPSIGHAGQPSGVPRRGGTLTMLVEPEPTTLVALTNSADPTMLVSGKVSEGLLAYDFDLRPQPQLATEWSVSDDGLQLTFVLRRGVCWSDGKPFTSRDVAHSVALLQKHHPRGRSTFANVAEVRTPDDYTAIFILTRAAPYLLQALAGCESPMLPEHIYSQGDEMLAANGAAPIGTGPFVFKEWVRGSHITYERNPGYWDQPKPYVDRLIVRFIEDPAAKVTAIETGAVDLAPATPLPLSEINRLRGHPDLAFETNGYQYTNQIVRIEFNLDDSLFADPKARRAVAHAIDRSALIECAWLRYGKPATGPISPDLSAFYDPDLRPPIFDPARAERLLDEAGLRRGPGGVRTRVPLDYVPAGDGYSRTASYIADALAMIGIEATVRTQDFGAYIRRIYSDRSFSLTVNRMNNMFDPSVGVQRVYWSKNFRRGVPFSNGSHYVNPEVDRLLEQAAAEQDVVKRRVDFRRFQETVVSDLPDISLLAPTQITVARKRVLDHTVTADGAAASLANAYIQA
ncbi:MAG: ABC transporter substrate-binding protein [Acidobacteriaceae bacterium]|nr:ABC transporter substrate-binding protein [Acidobacteriaceae bacterium]